MLSPARARRRNKSKQHVRTYAHVQPQPFLSLTSTSLPSSSCPPSCSSHSLPSLSVNHHPSPYCPSPAHHCYLSLSHLCFLYFLFLLPSSLLLLVPPPPFSISSPPASIYYSSLRSTLQTRHGGRNDSLPTPSDKHFESNSRHQ